ncbi:3-hydroxyacyl-CoA dehydrogenase [Nesterenkonia sp. AN1]|uniref:3-hydroxyacyl-CoA dehydrogenase n=1 Tax=Nesterenkonia aurantiaca TaxID=1436010 RepID=A0A4R7G7G4_9MICC|nr:MULTISPECIES: 3-hydroxyacyl-CoA dehydrogenase family protein [Nesterenkonia]EXF25700.1 3-hydroxyacyl-CoA dehydrogenase [Nesterenkonia sp. AN1]TDS87386.1 3-hydroxyacyl-CoA dehydrogenase [Nesterenkonia aurantiaca]
MTPDSTIDTIDDVLVVGAGAMGTQIGAAFALAGYTVTTGDLAAEALDQSRDEAQRRLRRLAEKGAFSSEEVDSALERMTYTTDSLEAARTTDFVLEAAVERIDIKRELFAALDEAAPEHVILATNSSTIPSSLLMDATARPDRVCNMHFFNPALVMNCVEVVRNPQTSDATVEAALGMVDRLGKQPVRLNKEIPGFVANRLLGALRNEALRLEADGVASYQDIDVAARTALGHPMGPFELMDLVGIDVSYLIRLSEYEQSGDPADLPHPSVQKLYEQGRYGRKNGRGWYEYTG